MANFRDDDEEEEEEEDKPPGIASAAIAMHCGFKSLPSPWLDSRREKSMIPSSNHPKHVKVHSKRSAVYSKSV